MKKILHNRRVISLFAVSGLTLGIAGCSSSNNYKHPSSIRSAMLPLDATSSALKRSVTKDSGPTLCVCQQASSPQILRR